MNTLAGLPITMLSGMGCAECGGTCGRSVAGLGVTSATSIDQIKAFFIGKGPNGVDKYIKHTKDIGLYHNPGEAYYAIVKKGDTIGKVVGLNSKGNWAKLESGAWVSLAPGVIENYYTVELTTPPPKSVADAVGREAEKVVDAIPFIPSLTTIKVLLGVAVVLGVGIVAYKLFPEETKGAFKSAKGKLKTA